MGLTYLDARKILERITNPGYLRTDSNVDAVLNIAYPKLKEPNRQKRYRIAEKVYSCAQEVITQTERDEEDIVRLELREERCRKSLDELAEKEQIAEWLQRSGIPKDLEPYIRVPKVNTSTQRKKKRS